MPAEEGAARRPSSAPYYFQRLVMHEHKRLNAALDALRLPEDTRDAVAALVNVSLAVRHLNALAHEFGAQERDGADSEIAASAIMAIAHVAHKALGVTPEQFLHAARVAAEDLDDALLAGLRLIMSPTAGGTQ